MNIQIDLSPKYQYEPLYRNVARYKDLWGGRGRGGSHEATLYALFRLTSPAYCRIAFVRKIYKDVRTSLWRDFKDRIEECNIPDSDIDITDHEMRATYKPTGNVITCFGVKAEGGRTAKLKSLAGYNLIIVEELDEILEEEFDQLDDSVRTVKGDPPEIVRIFNPPGKNHWVWRDYNLKEIDAATYGMTDSEAKKYWRATPKESSGILSIFGTYRDNIKNLAATTLEKWRRYRATKPEYYFTIIEGLISEGQRGRIFTGWETVTEEFFKLIDAREIFGQDFGGSSPAGLVGCKFVKNNLYLREHNYEPMTGKDLGKKYCTLGFTGKELIIADSAEPITISNLMNGWDDLTAEESTLYPQLRKGFNIMGAFKGPGSIEAGIKTLQDYNVFVVETSLNLLNEYRSYKWALDKDKNPTDVPEDANNHLIDPTRYVATAKGRFF